MSGGRGGDAARGDADRAREGLRDADRATLEAVIVDVDGTLCDVSGVRHYVRDDPRNRNYEKFHAASALCPPHPSAVEWVHEQRARGRTVIVVTARKRRWEFVTRRWMRKWGIPCDWLLMRADDDQRRDREVKADILTRIRARGYRVVAAIDDNPAVVDLWRSEGIDVTVVPGWDGEGESAAERAAGRPPTDPPPSRSRGPATPEGR